MTDNIYTDAAQHDAVIAARATITAPGVVLVNRERLAQLEAIAEAAQEVLDEFIGADTSVKQMLRLNDLSRALAKLAGQG